MKAGEVLDAIEAHHRAAAFVRELTVADSALSATLSSLPADVSPEQAALVARIPAYRRIDALMFEGLQRTAIEVKVTVADANREDWHKVAPWRHITHRFVYATPAGLIDHPPVYGCGLWWIHDDGHVEVKRQARINHHPEPLPQRVVQNLAYRACGRSTITAPTREGGQT